jgi:hypothetical protein
MSDLVRDLIAELHQVPCRYVVALTGGGSGLAGRLLSVPGGSKTVLDIVVPYGAEALCDFLGFWPESFCSTATSRDMARRACERARRLAPGSAVLGLGCTASLRSDRPKRGDHRCHTSIHTARETRTWSLTLTKDARSRAEEEAIVDLLALNALAEGLGVARRVPIPLLPGEEVLTEATPRTDPFAAFLQGRVAVVRAALDGRLQVDVGRPRLVLSGSFNPLHEAHLELARRAAVLEQEEAEFELTVANADKPPLADEEVRRRLAQFVWRGRVWLTRAPTFVEKARLFPGAAFVVGTDTACRIVAPRFYGDSEARMDGALNEFRGLGCRFLVAGRVDASGTFVGPEQVAIPERHRDLFHGIPFRRDISSTQLREQEQSRQGAGAAP